MVHDDDDAEETDDNTYVELATFRSVEAAEAFRRRLQQHDFKSLRWSPDAVGVTVLVPLSELELAGEFLVESYGVPPGFPAEECCPSCARRVAEKLDNAEFEWRCLACGQQWGPQGPRRW